MGTSPLGEFPSEDANTSESGAATRRRAWGRKPERVEGVKGRSSEITLWPAHALSSWDRRIRNSPSVRGSSRSRRPAIAADARATGWLTMEHHAQLRELG